jgi:hypothetical protein
MFQSPNQPRTYVTLGEWETTNTDYFASPLQKLGLLIRRQDTHADIHNLMHQVDSNPQIPMPLLATTTDFKATSIDRPLVQKPWWPC